MTDENNFFQKNIPTFTEVSSHFPGMGTLLIKGESLIHHIKHQYSLTYTQLPLLTYKHALNNFFENLFQANFTDITVIFFLDETEDIYIECIKEFTKKNIKKNLSVKMHEIFFKDFTDFLSEQRVALTLTDTDNSSLDYLKHCLNIDIYVGLMINMEFKVSAVSLFVYRPFKTDFILKFGNKENKNIRVFCTEIEDEIFKQNKNFNLEKIKSICEENLENFSYFKSTKNQISESLCMAVRKEIKEKEDFIFDGRILVNDCISEGAFVEYAEDREVDNTNPTTNKGDFQVETLIIPAVTSVKNSLELSITKRDDRPRKNTQYYSQHLKKAAMSLFGGKLLYNPIKRLSKHNEKPEKKSKKQIQFIKENEKKLETEKRKKELIFLKSFYVKYLNLDTESRKNYLENFMEGGYSDSVIKKIILLKIEFYFDLWSLEKRKEEINEKVLIPCYLNCLNFIDRFISDPEKFKNISNLEMEFVFQKLIDCGFESTTLELLHKYNLSPNLTFTSQKVSKKPNDLDIYFQLKFAGDKLKRTLDSVKDKRVLFEPDKWQVDLLNLVDENRSAVVSAPTSSGKTFICFYAIEKVLRESDDGIVIFCLPTKALVNQVAADVYARFVTKVYSKKNMVLQGILMKDYQIDPYNCQVLITVPSMLESLLKSPPQNYINKLNYIIIDEIHKISSEEMGVHIERIIHLSPCPLLVLSATIGNLQNFYNWIENIEKLKNRKCNLVIHKERYCDLKMYIFNTSLIPINPLFAYSVSYIKLHGKINTDLNFLPEDLLDIYYSVYAVLKKEQKYLIKELKPSKFFKSNILSKKDVKEYESFLLEKIFYWIRNNVLEYQQVSEMYSYIVGDIERAFEYNNLGLGSGKEGNEEDEDNTTVKEEDKNSTSTHNTDYLCDNILPLLNTLKEQNLLPCIVFNTDRSICNKLALKVLSSLEAMELTENINKVEIKKREKLLKEMKRSRDEKKKEDDWKEESIKEEENIEILAEEKKNLKYCFLDSLNKLSDYELEEQIREVVRGKSIDKLYLEILGRGIGIHHNGMNKKYRELVEILFRTKHLNVVFSTDTLSLGINMPCRSVVFAGDSLCLDSLNYRQMAGRAGRRGFDTLGHVVFLGVSKRKIQNLMVSKVPDLKGSYSFVNSSLLCFNKEYLISLFKYPLFGESVNKGFMDRRCLLIKKMYDNLLLYRFIENKGGLGLGGDVLGMLGEGVLSDKNSSLKGVSKEYDRGSNIKGVSTGGSNIKGVSKEYDNDSSIEGVSTEYDNDSSVKGFNHLSDIQQGVSKESDTDSSIKGVNHLSDIQQDNKTTTNTNISLSLTSLSDLVISNISCDPSVFLIVFLINSTAFDPLNDLEPVPFISFISNFIQVKPLPFKTVCTLPKLNDKIYKVCEEINKKYLKESKFLYEEDALFLQRQSKTPIKKYSSFFYVSHLDSYKNSYILDFFLHGRLSDLESVNGVKIKELFGSLNVFYNFLSSLCRVMEVYGVSESIRKRVYNVYVMFGNRFMPIFA